MANLTPEQRARQQIDTQLIACGWVVQDYRAVDFSAGRGIALREAPLKSGTCDYLLLVDRKAVGVTEAKKEGTLLSGVAEQSAHYGKNLPDFIQSIGPGSLPFLYESTGVETFFRDELADEACAPFGTPALRDALAKAKQDAEQTIDTVTIDTVLSQGFDATAKAKAAGLVEAFRDYLTVHQTEIDALQILYSRPYKQRLTEPMLKDLEKKLRDNHAAWTEDNLWNAFAVTAPDKVKGRSQVGRFADLVALVRFALEQQPVLAPFADSVSERFSQWLMDRAKADREAGRPPFTPEQLAWLNLIRDHIATSLSIELEDLEFSPFNQRGGLGKAHQLFGAQLPTLLDELNEALAA